MKGLIVFLGLCGVCLAAPGLLGQPVVLTRLHQQNLAPIGADGRVVDTRDVAVAKAEHAAAQLNQRAKLANQEARASGSDEAGAPIGPDGRVIDTPAVALAKAQHATAQLIEKANQANARSEPLFIAIGAPATPYITLDRIIY